MSATEQSVVLTGATGFIGSATLAELVRRGRRVIVLLRPTSDRRRIACLRGYETVMFDHFGEAGLAARIQEYNPGVFIHCAWRGVAGDERNASYQITENVPMTIASAALAAGCGCQQWVGLGSQAEYGNPNRVISEATPENPATIYGKAKLAAGHASLALCEALGIAGVWLRVFSIFGPQDAPHWFIPSAIQDFLAGRKPRLTKCEQRWAFLYIKDAAKAVVAAADGRLTGVYNLGSGRADTLREVIQVIRTELGTTIEPDYGAIHYRPEQVMHLQADIRKLSEATGWAPAVGLVEGLRETIKSEKNLFMSCQTMA